MKRGYTRGLMGAVLAVPLLLIFVSAARGEETPRGSGGIELVYTAPGCLEPLGWQSVSLSMLWDHFAHREGSFFTRSSGFSAMTGADRTLLPPGSATDVMAVSAFLKAGGPLNREVIAEELPVLVSAWDVKFQFPFEGHFDWLQVVEKITAEEPSRLALRREMRRLVRYTAADGSSVLSLEEQNAKELVRDPLEYVRPVLTVNSISTPDDEVAFYAFSRPLYRGSRVRAEIKRLMGSRAEQTGDAFLLHPGGLAGGGTVGDLFGWTQDFCGASLEGLGLDAVVPRKSELSLGPEGLLAFARGHGLPYVATNLSRVEEGKTHRVFPRFRLLETSDGLTIAVLGVVGPDQLDGVPVALRAPWKIDDPVLSVQGARKALEQQLHRAPDLVVALVATEKGETASRLIRHPGVDLVIGLSGGTLQEDKREWLEVVPPPEGTQGNRWRSPVMAPRGSPSAVGRVTARFVPGKGGGPRVLDQILHESWQVGPVGDEDEAYRAEARRRLEDALPGSAMVMLPDIEPLVRGIEALEPLVWGEVLIAGILRNYPPSFPAKFTDPLWMRLVTNSVLVELGADVVLSRNLPRHGTLVGPIPRGFINLWTAAPDELREVTLSGAELQGLVQRLRSLGRKPADRGQIFAGGLNPQTGVVRGRAIHPKHSYKVVVTDHVMSHPMLSPLLMGKPTEERFLLGSGGRFVPNAMGEALGVGAVVQRVVGRWQSPQGGFDPVHTPAFQRLLSDLSQNQVGRWTLLVEEISLQGSSYGNSSNVDTFAASKETRVTTPTHFSVGARTEVAFEYEGPDVAWTNRLKQQIQHQDFDVPGKDIPPQESADDVVLSSELRLNAVKIGLGSSNVPLVPFLKAAYDTELTPTPRPQPTEDDPRTHFAHQHLVRASVGQVIFPRVLFREIRLGGLFQGDLSEMSNVRYDLGLEGSFKLRQPLFGPVSLESDFSLRYLFPDDQDSDADLGLVISSVTRLVVPVSARIQLFGFADLYFVQGKTPTNSSLGGSRMFGMGLSFSHFLGL